MATDLADWTQGVNVTGGSVSISGTATVTISGTPNVNIANTPAVTVNSGTVSIGNTPSVVISGTPTVILGGGTATVGAVSAINSTVTVAGTVNIGNTPAVTISGTPTVNINSGTVSITGTPVVNVQAANGVAIVGPNLLPTPMRGPITAGWEIAFNLTSLAFNADGTLTATATAAGDAAFRAPLNLSGGYALVPVIPGETYQFSCGFKQLDRANTFTLAGYWCDATGAQQTFFAAATIAGVVGTWVAASGSAVVPPGAYFVSTRLYPQSAGTGLANDRCQVDHVSVQNVGAFAINAQQSQLPVVTHVNICDLEVHGFGVAGAQASVDFAAVAGRSLVFQIVTGTIVLVAAGGPAGATFAIHDGLNLLPANAQWGSFTGVTNVIGDKDRLHATDMGIRVPTGSASRVGFEVAVAGASQSVSAGAYLV